MKRYISLSLIAFLLFVVSCIPTPKPPTSFIPIDDSAMMGWKTIELRSGVNYDEAWETLADIIAIKWDIEFVNKNIGYLRTGWSYKSGMDKNVRQPFSYGRRLSAKFNKSKNQLQIKTEAFYQVKHPYQLFPIIYGVDNAFNEDVFTEISGKLGRTTR